MRGGVSQSRRWARSVGFPGNFGWASLSATAGWRSRRTERPCNANWKLICCFATARRRATCAC
eukprot:6716960-Pyramimonas_sp.AAC.1